MANNEAKAGNWGRDAFVPSGFVSHLGLGPQGEMALKIRVKAMHHWIRKGNADNAARSASAAAHIANPALRRMEAARLVIKEP
jgi:hypothetical protein